MSRESAEGGKLEVNKDDFVNFNYDQQDIFDSEDPNVDIRMDTCIDSIWFHDGLLTDMEVVSFPDVRVTFESEKLAIQKLKEIREAVVERREDDSEEEEGDDTESGTGIEKGDSAKDGERHSKKSKGKGKVKNRQQPTSSISTVESTKRKFELPPPTETDSLDSKILMCALLEATISTFSGVPCNLLQAEPAKMIIFLVSLGMPSVSKPRLLANENYPSFVKKMDCDWTECLTTVMAAYLKDPTINTVKARLAGPVGKETTLFNQENWDAWEIALKMDSERPCIVACSNLLCILFRIFVKDNTHMTNIPSLESWKSFTALCGLKKVPPNVKISEDFVNSLKPTFAWIRSSVVIVTMTEFIANKNFSPAAMAGYFQRLMYYSFNPWLNLVKIQLDLGVSPLTVLRYFYTAEMATSVTSLLTASQIYGSKNNARAFRAYNIPAQSTLKYFPICRLLNEQYCSAICTRACRRVACCLFGFVNLETDYAMYAIPNLAMADVVLHMKAGAYAREVHMAECPGVSSRYARRIFKNMDAIKEMGSTKVVEVPTTNVPVPTTSAATTPVLTLMDLDKI